MTTGTYDLSYQKTGFGTMKVYGLSHFGGGTEPTAVENVYVVHIPAKTAPDNRRILYRSCHRIYHIP